MVEIELKFQIKVGDIKRLMVLLKQRGCILTQKRTYEKTVMYDNPAQIMQITDGRLRLRASGPRYELSYKKPITRQGIKREREYEVIVSDFKMAEKILAMMEFKPATSYERYRTTFQKDRLKVTIDEYPFASFIEIEGPEKEIVDLAEVFGFSSFDNLTESCDTLFQKWRRQKGLPFKPHMLFKDYDK